MKYVLTGATGGLGSQVLKYLLRLVPASDIAVSLYNPQGASAEIKDAGAFRGADKLLIVSYPSIAHELRAKNHINAIDAAKRCGVKHVYYTSLAFGTGSVAAVMKAHLDTENYLKESGLKYTILREGIYSESYPLYLGFFDPSEGNDEILIPHSDGGIAWVSREDLGEGTAKIMVDGGYENGTFLLSGSRCLTLQKVGEQVATILGRHIRLKVVSEDEYVKRNVGRPGPRGEEQFLHAWATTYQGLARGELDVVDPLLQRVVGRELKPIEETLKEMLGVAGDAAVMEQYAK
ncbi:Quinone oxidoreductase 2 [Grifola frondosa]|uniref:Quinone oxidoreductase 2 n=1 Tax=Grifola frondosa TaxID=5627 RepID=A0A1C7LZT5_GRIFR|nr:Quinone oxidoreductase 2 [Grifola frondosa]